MDRQELGTAFGNALISFFEWAFPRVSPRMQDVAERVKEFLVPDPPMIVKTLDGEVLSGFLLVDRSHVLIFVGARTPSRQGAPTYDHHARRNDDGAIPLWAREIDPRDLQDLEVDPYRRR